VTAHTYVAEGVSLADEGRRKRPRSGWPAISPSGRRARRHARAVSCAATKIESPPRATRQVGTAPTQQGFAVVGRERSLRAPEGAKQSRRARSSGSPRPLCGPRDDDRDAVSDEGVRSTSSRCPALIQHCDAAFPGLWAVASCRGDGRMSFQFALPRRRRSSRSRKATRLEIDAGLYAGDFACISCSLAAISSPPCPRPASRALSAPEPRSPTRGRRKSPRSG
jgi:hypothetical protein